MRIRSTYVVMAGALVFALALARALFFWRGAPDLLPVDLSWDPASHILIGLDLFDALRHLDPVSFVTTAFNEHWWPPLFGLLTLPLHVVFGRNDMPARVISLVCYAALPAICSSAVVVWSGRAAAAATAGVALTLVLFLTSPQLVEMSRWPMLESCAAAMGLASILAFSVSDRPGWHRLAFVLAGSSLLLKYHYGFFLLITLTGGVVLRIGASERARLARLLLAIVRPPAVRIALAIVAILLLLPSELASRVRWIPKAEGVPWVAYVTTLLAVLGVPSLRARARETWATLPLMIRDFVRCGLSIPGVWCLDPANARVWYRQVHLISEPPAVPREQVAHLVRFLTYDYVSSAVWALPVVIVGLVALVRRRRPAYAWPLVLHGIWPMLLMTASGYRAEARFVASLVPVIFSAAVLGWCDVLAAMHGSRRRLVTAALAVPVVMTVWAASSRAADMTARKAYRYRYTPAEGAFVEAATARLARDQPVLVILPADVEVTRTLRLFLRMRMPDVAPADVFVMNGDQGDLLGRLRRFRHGIIAFDARWPSPQGVVRDGEIALPGGAGRALLVTERRDR